MAVYPEVAVVFPEPSHVDLHGLLLVGCLRGCYPIQTIQIIPEAIGVVKGFLLDLRVVRY